MAMARRSVKWGGGLAVMVLLLGAHSEQPPASAVPGPCSRAWEWTEAEALVPSQSAGGPIDGISATLSALDPTTQLLPCVNHPDDNTFGSSAVYINLSEYDRRTGVGGNLIQLGIARGTWWEHRLVFVRSEDNSAGELIALPAPYPQAGHTYTFAISLEGDRWHLRIREGGNLIHELTEAAHWTAAATGWAMFETLGRGSLLGGGNEAHAPTWTDLVVSTASGQANVPAAGCDLRRVRRDSKGAWLIDGEGGRTQCVVGTNGSFSAFTRP